MRVFAGLGLLIVAGLVPQSGHAAGNVLLPESSSGQSSSSYSGLGLVPRLPSPSAPAQNEPQNVQKVRPAPAPAVLSPMPSASIVMPTIVEPTVNADADRMRKYPRDFQPTKVAHMPPPVAPKIGARAFTISLSDRSTFTSDDLNKIGEKLGIDPNRAASLCRLSLRGSLKTTKDTYFVDGGTGPRAQVAYSGEIVDQSLRTVAVCPSTGPLPQGVGTVIETSGSYIIPLRDLNCDVEVSPQATGLLAKYSGDTSECALAQ